jgi:hypothetical protein
MQRAIADGQPLKDANRFYRLPSVSTERSVDVSVSRCLGG